MGVMQPAGEVDGVDDASFDHLADGVEGRSYSEGGGFVHQAKKGLSAVPSPQRWTGPLGALPSDLDGLDVLGGMKKEELLVGRRDGAA